MTNLLEHHRPETEALLFLTQDATAGNAAAWAADPELRLFV
ncbi:MAG: hypothetical protein WCJ09_16085 [Planctomycetota bacterium]